MTHLLSQSMLSEGKRSGFENNEVLGVTELQSLLHVIHQGPDLSFPYRVDGERRHDGVVVVNQAF
jgi:hypothetical protein